MDGPITNNRNSWSINNPDYTGWSFTDGVMLRANLVWDTNTLAWVKSTGGTGPGTNVAVTNFPSGQATEATLAKIPGLSLPIHDYLSLGYTGSDLTTVVYKTGGSGGTTVATLTLTYSASVLQTVTKT